MNKQNNRLALSVLATLTTGIALIYTLIMYHNIIFAVVGMSILFLITAFILTQNLIAFSTMKNKSINVHIKECIDDISTQLEAINGSQSQIGKATYLYTKQTAQVITRLEDNYAESQMTLYKNLASLSNLQNKATKLMIKYDQSNTTKLISTIKDLRNQLSETLIQGFDQIQPNNAEIISALEDIVVYLKSQPDGMDQTMGLQLNNIAHELQNVSNSIKQAQNPVQQIMQQMPTDNMASFAADTTIPDTSIHTGKAEETVSEYTPEQVGTVDDGIDPSVTDLFEPEAFVDESITETPEPTSDADEQTKDTILPENNTLSVTMPADNNSNDMMSADEIAALFAATEPVPKKETEKPFTPTFTVVGKSGATDTEPSEAEANPTTVIDALDTNSDKQLSADEIAALFAAADPAPKKEDKPVMADFIQEPSNTDSVSEDPNKQLSPDEIAALFAAADPTPKKESTSEEEEKQMDISDDPNKKLSPDEIAALFASLG